MIVCVITLLLSLIGGCISAHAGVAKRSPEDDNLPALERGTRKAIADDYYRWTNGVIPYEFLRGHFNSTEKAGLRKAMALWSEHTCVKFRPATRDDKNIVVFKDGSSCYSMVGMVGGKQYLTLSRVNHCRTMGLYLHELGHTIGLFHEHQLPSRDQYIRVHLGHMHRDSQSAFKKKKPEEVKDYGVPYDITSIMHYGKYAMGSRSGLKTMESKDRSKDYMIVPVADKKIMSFSDMKVVNLMYSCSKHCAPDPSCTNPAFLDENCKCIQPIYIEFCRNKNAKCERWKSNNQCKDNKVFMERNCPISCGLCTPRDGITDEVFPTEAPKKIDCRNKNPQCEIWKKSRQCTLNKRYMDDMCPLACGICEPEGGVGTEKKPQVACVNTYEDKKCKDWANGKQCKNNPGFMLKNCAKACEVCKGEETGSTQGGDQGTETSEACVNKYGDKKCKGWAKGNGCNNNPSFMHKECAKACKVCKGEETESTQGGDQGTETSGDKDTQTSAACVNKYGDKKCKGWAKGNGCNNNPTFMHKQCAKACKVCKGEETESTQGGEQGTETSGDKDTQTSADCVDKDRGCAGWAKADFCKSNKFTRDNCHKSCGTC